MTVTKKTADKPEPKAKDAMPLRHCSRCGKETASHENNGALYCSECGKIRPAEEAAPNA